jgi:tetratricopeptide (TPR) repeat protein
VSRRAFVKTGLTAAAGAALLGPAALAGCAPVPPPVSRYYHPRYRTVAHLMLDIEAEHKTAEQRIDDDLLLDQLIEGADARLGSLAADRDISPAQARIVLAALDKLLESCGFSYRRDGTLGQALRLGGVNCDSSSALYLAFGEVARLPIKMVRAPGHTFVRWHLKNGDYINWETTVGEERTDSHYILKHKIPEATIGRSALHSLDVKRDRRRILANAYVNCGVSWVEKCEPEKAVERFHEAARRDPFYVSPCYNLGLSYLNLGDPDSAVIWARHAVRLNPNHVRSHAILVAAYEELSNRLSSELHRLEVERIDPGYYSTKRAKKRSESAGRFCA